jgi:hypothetical protein
MWPLAVLILLLGMTAGLTACGSQALLTGASLSASTISPNGTGLQDHIDLNYSLGQAGKICIAVQTAAGQPIFIHKDIDRQPGDYTLNFRGLVAADNGDMRVLPDGQYKMLLSVAGANGQKEDQSFDFAVKDADTALPQVTEASAYPQTISPNYDAIDDVAQISFRLSKKANVSVFVGKPGGQRYIIKSFEKADPAEYKVTFNGTTAEGKLLDNGDYQFFIVATDTAGNQVTQTGPVSIQNGGQPQIKVLDVQFEPQRLMQGQTVKVTIRVKNMGKVVLRTQGPDPGFTYTTNETFASVNNGQYVDKAGLWRVGVDWDGNSGSGPRRYPFRWGLGRDLQPGEEATITGNITILQNEKQMSFYAGVIQEGIGFPADQLGRTLIEVGL